MPSKYSLLLDRKYKLKRKYGLSLDDYDELFDGQNGVCAICGRPETASLNGVVKRLAVDHNHTTGEIRGLLCNSCNNLVGKTGEDIDKLKKVIEYLEEYK